MSRVELFSVKKILHHKYTTHFFLLHKVQNDYDNYMHKKNVSILFDILGPSDIFAMAIRGISAN